MPAGIFGNFLQIRKAIAIVAGGIIANIAIGYGGFFVEKAGVVQVADADDGCFGWNGWLFCFSGWELRKEDYTINQELDQDFYRDFHGMHSFI